jgi:hypothetical protein
MMSCHNCKEPLNEVNLQVCSGCQRASYCSLACHKADWKFHKKRCKLYQLVKDETREMNQPYKDKAREMNVKRSLRLLDEFVRKSDLSHLFADYFEWETLKSIEPRQLVVLLKVKCNYSGTIFALFF